MKQDDTTPPSTDFRAFKQSGERAGVSRAIGQGFCDARNAVARGLIAIHVTPNMLTIAGFVATCAAAWFFFIGGGGSYTQGLTRGGALYPFLAGVALVVASAFDMLDGAVAKLGKLQTSLGAVLDSSVDRLSDAAVYIGLAGHFMLAGNLTYTLFATVALMNAMMISYVKARSENLIPKCEVGYWMRGERSAALLISAFAGNMSALLWQQAISPAFTVLRRIVYTYLVLEAKEKGREAPLAGPAPGVKGLLKPWRYPRGSIPYDIVTGTNIAFLIFAPKLHAFFGPTSDPLRALLSPLL